MHLVTPAGAVAQRSALAPGQKAIPGGPRRARTTTVLRLHHPHQLRKAPEAHACRSNEAQQRLRCSAPGDRVPIICGSPVRGPSCIFWTFAHQASSCLRQTRPRPESPHDVDSPDGHSCATDHGGRELVNSAWTTMIERRTETRSAVAVRGGTLEVQVGRRSDPYGVCIGQA